jgi:hypothetical protein
MAHRELADGRWATLSLVTQLANVGSEVERVLRSTEAGNAARRERALDRALELFDLTAADERWRGPRRREILRAREYTCAVVLGSAAAADDPAFLKKYFLHFAVAARAG